jgi:hypothetical protein
MNVDPEIVVGYGHERGGDGCSDFTDSVPSFGDRNSR